MAKSIKRYVVPSDNHKFVGRIYDLSIVALHFETYKALSKYADCKYVYDVNDVLSALTQRVESLNMVGSMLWPTNIPTNFKNFPVSRYEWLLLSLDAFLARYISVVDCAMILVNEVFECGLLFESCTMQCLKKKPVARGVLIHIGEMIDAQGLLRKERNSRFHHGSERGFSSDDQVFRIGACFEHRFKGMVRSDGRALPVQQLFKEGLIELQREFNSAMRKVVENSIAFMTCLNPSLRAVSHRSLG